MLESHVKLDAEDRVYWNSRMFQIKVFFAEVCSLRGCLIAGFLVLCMPLPVFGQEQTPKVQIKAVTGFRTSSNPIEEQTDSGYRIVVSTQWDGTTHQFERLDNSGSELLRQAQHLISGYDAPVRPMDSFWNSRASDAEMSANAFELEPGWDRFRDLQELANNAQMVILEGNSKTLQFRLSQEPSSSGETLTVEGYQGTNLSVNPPNLTFTRANWDQPQDVVVTAGQDENDVPEQITLTAVVAGQELQQIEVTIIDDETLREFSPQTIQEGAATSIPILLLRILGPPSEDVVFTVTGHENTDIMLLESKLTFPAANWQQSKRLGISAKLDDDHLDEQVILTLTASGGGYDGLKYTLRITIVDRLPGQHLIPEGGTRRLRYQITGPPSRPSGDVQVTIEGHEGTDLVVDPASLVFRRDLWFLCRHPDRQGIVGCSEPKEVKLTARHDPDHQDDQIKLEVMGHVPGFGPIYREEHVKIEDDDDAGLIVVDPFVEIEEGGTEIFRVKLSNQPLGNLGTTDVIVSIPSSVGDVARDSKQTDFHDFQLG